MAGVREGAQLLRAGLDAALDTFKDEVAPATPEDAVAVSNETEQRVRAARHCRVAGSNLRINPWRAGCEASISDITLRLLEVARVDVSRD